MKIETDDEFVAAMRERFASQPYTHGAIIPSAKEYWTDERYEALIADLLSVQRTIRRAAETRSYTSDAMAPEDYDRATAEWAIWQIQHNDVGQYPTHWHRVWCAIRMVIVSTRHGERSRIGRALRAEHSALIGKTATDLIEQAVIDGVETE